MTKNGSFTVNGKLSLSVALGGSVFSAGRVGGNIHGIL